MSDGRLFAIEEYPEVPVFRPSARRKGEGDARFRGEYPPEWDRCTTCGGRGRTNVDAFGQVYDSEFACPACQGMGSLKAQVRLLAGHRCERCLHPYVPQKDAAMLGVEASGLHLCEQPRCLGGKLLPLHGNLGENAEIPQPPPVETCPTCKGAGRVWTPWSACDERCQHAGPLRLLGADGRELDYGEAGQIATPIATLRSYERVTAIEAEWRVLTCHHLDGNKSNCQPYNIAALCQRDHLLIQHKVVMERVYPYPHSPWFRWHAAGYYADVYLGLRDLTRAQIEARMDELLALELCSV